MSILLSLQAVGSQAADQMPDLTAVTLPTEAEINVIDLAFKGGWIMVVLLLLSLMAIYIFVQRLIIIRRAGKEDETFMNRIKDYIHEGKVDSALNLCRSTNTPSARMIEKGITRLGRPMNDVLVATGRRALRSRKAPGSRPSPSPSRQPRLLLPPMPRAFVTTSLR